MEAKSFANPEVLAFYRELPFNYRQSPDEDVRAIRASDAVRAYPILRPLLGPGVRVLDVGCGAGWLSNSVCHHYGASVLGIDFNSVAVARAREVAAAMGIDTRFETADLFTFEPEKPFDVVLSVGVLHHTDNCLAAVRRCCETFVRPGGHVMIGLYHSYGRRPFLEHFREMQRSGASEQEMFERYRKLHAQLEKDETHLRSWFRDQVLHPHETQHTLKEMVPILEETGMELLSTSINRFGAITSLEALYQEELAYEALAVERLRQDRYFPGFFVFLARKREESGRGLLGRLGARLRRGRA
jgi:SAM-dependent methyltransferase